MVAFTQMSYWPRACQLFAELQVPWWRPKGATRWLLICCRERGVHLWESSRGKLGKWIGWTSICKILQVQKNDVWQAALTLLTPFSLSCKVWFFNSQALGWWSMSSRRVLLVLVYPCSFPAVHFLDVFHFFRHLDLQEYQYRRVNVELWVNKDLISKYHHIK